MKELASLRPLIAQGVGGIILYGRPPADLKAQLTALAKAAGDWPLVVSSDEEGGGVQRLASITVPLWWARHQTAWGVKKIRAKAAAMARKLTDLGVRVDLAPVVDLDAGPGPDANHPDGLRSYSANAKVTTAAALAFAEGLQDGGVIPVFKHYPGLGTAKGNTDAGAAKTAPWSVIQRNDLLPFKAAIRAGYPAIMTSNAIVPGLTSKPVSISSAAINDELRSRLGFDGVVFTDSLSAQALRVAGYDVPRAAVAALQAGADEILFGTGSTTHPAALVQSVRAAIVAAVQNGQLSIEQLRTAVVRIATMMGKRTC